MTKSVDYYITAVRYHKNRAYVDHVRMHNNLKQADIPRSEVISYIDAGMSISTAEKIGESWIKGADVITVTINGVRFIKTEPNDTASDNLGNLPEF